MTLCSEYEQYVPSVVYPVGKRVAGDTLEMLIEKAAVKTGITVNFVHQPWKRCMKMVEDGEADGLFPIIATDSRSERYRFPQTAGGHLLRVDYPLFVLRGGLFDRDDTKTPLVEKNGLNEDLYRVLKQKGLAAPYGYVMTQQLMAPVFRGPTALRRLSASGR